MLREAVSWGSCKPDRVQTALNRSDFITVALHDGHTIGMARVMQDGLQALIMDVIVLPDYQRHGIGKSIMDQVMAYLNDLSRGGDIKLNLMSAVETVQFYERYGFESRPNENRGPGMTQTLITKEKPQ